MNITHINTHDIAGGAAKVAWRLAEEQRLRGHQSCMLVGCKFSASEHVHSFAQESFRNLHEMCSEEGLLYYDLQGSHNLIFNPLVTASDILHLHNLHGNYFNPFSLSALSHKKNLIWTLHDMQAITGHCAHSFTCQRWETGCGSCPHLNVEPALNKDSSDRLWNDKKLIYDNSYFHIVVPSDWLKKKVEKSILKNHPVSLVYNGVNTRIYKPYDKVTVRNELGIPVNALVIGSAAHGGALSNQWKGGQFSQSVLDELFRSDNRIIFLNLGANLDNSNKKIYNTGHINDEELMSKFYNCMDLFFYTPIADNCPLVILEALSCGVPIVSFNVGGISELVKNGESGLITCPGDSREMVAAIKYLLADQAKNFEMRHCARLGAEKYFDHSAIVDGYMKIYEGFFFNSKKERPVKYFDFKNIPEVIKTEPFLKSEDEKLTSVVSRYRLFKQMIWSFRKLYNHSKCL